MLEFECVMEYLAGRDFDRKPSSSAFSRPPTVCSISSANAYVATSYSFALHSFNVLTSLYPRSAPVR